MERDFRYLLEKYGEAGARDIFEKICVQLFQEVYGERAKSVAVSQGDGGLDVLVGEIPSPEKVYQCKFFLEKLGNSQKQQIRESFATVTNNYTVKEWFLCLPRILTEDELLWWSKWKNEKELTSGVKLELCDGSFLINSLKKYDIYKKEFDDDIRQQLDLIQKELSNQQKRIINEVIYSAERIPEIENKFDEFIFVKMLESARVTDTEDCKIDFFNAEISRQVSISKDEIEGLKIYNNLKGRIYSLWKNQFRRFKESENGNNLLYRTYLRIEDLDSSTLISSEEYSLLSKKGILHQLANDKEIGWVEGYLEKLAEYIEET